MSTDTKIKTLIFNKLTQEQYDNADRVPTEFYLTPDTSIDSSEKGVANGVATLDANTKVPVAQIPDLSSTYATIANTVSDVVAGSTADKINVTKNGSTSTITINNVANATTASKVEATVAAGSDLDIVRATVASSDYARVRVGGAAEAGYLEVATADDGKEPIYVRQYTGNFATVKRTATLLDASGNTTFPGTVAASGFTGYVNGDNYINWGGPNLSSDMSPSDAGCLDENGHNKAAFFGGKITVEYSTDGGTTWTTPKVLTDEEKFRLTTKGDYDVKIGNVTTSGVITSENVTNYLSRITLSSRNASGDTAFYTAMKKLILDVSTNGATGTTVKVETRNIADYNAGNDTWSTIGSYIVSGWSGYNSIPCVFRFGGRSSQTDQIADLRLTMSATGASTTSSNNFNVTGIRIIGVTNWGVNAFAYTGHIYDFDYQKNVTFPAKVTARSGFEGNLTGSVTFPNHTWNLVGDDVYIGDCSVSGCLGVKGKNAATGIVFKPYSGSTDQKISINGSGTMTITGTVASTFRGNLTGTADKSVKDGDGNTISSTYVKVAQKGVANGVASLDTNAKVPTGQIPVATASALGGVKPDGNTITVTEDGTISATVSGDNVATKAELQDRVAKAGDTMTGPLKMSGEN